MEPWMQADDLHDRSVRAERARQFMRDPLFAEMFTETAAYLDQVSLSCDPDDKDRAQRIIISRQLLEAMRKEIERRVEDGDFAAFSLAELEKRKKWKVFQR
jgi:hypothetical protein